MIMCRKTCYCQDVTSSYRFNAVPNQNPSKLFCEYQQSASEVYMKR